MNANELIELLDKNAGDGDTPLRQAVILLRQQQAEIEALRSLSLRRENLGYFYDLHTRQQAEIEALKKEKGHIGACPNSDDANSFARVSQSIIAKTLTDEEILKEMEFLPQTISMEDEDYIAFARAILLKAQEK